MGGGFALVLGSAQLFQQGLVVLPIDKRLTRGLVDCYGFELRVGSSLAQLDQLVWSQADLPVQSDLRLGQVVFFCDHCLLLGLVLHPRA